MPGPDPPGREDVSARVRRSCDDRVVLTVWRSSLLGIPASIILVLILGGSVPRASAIAFVMFVSIADVTCFLVFGAYLRSRRRGQNVSLSWMGPACAGLIGLAWGSLALIGLPDEQHLDRRIVYLLFIAGCSATYVVGAAARRSYYWSSQLPMIAIPAFVFLRSGDQTTQLLGIAIVIYFGVMTVLHRDVHDLVLSELTLRQENEAAALQLSYQARHDALTGLANRPAFFTQAAEAFSSTGENTIVGILYIDIDRFKVVNDSLGHAAGDDLLARIASRMANALDDRAFLARLGGDEFTVLLPALDSEGAAVRVADRILSTFDQPFKLLARSVTITASVGVATIRASDGDASSLLAQADAAQYKAKQTGRNRVEIFNVQLRRSLAQRLDEEQRVRRAIEAGEIVAWYQPIVEIDTGRIIAIEALARWLHPTRGVLDAAKFVPLIEESGLIVALDECIIRQAVAATKDIEALSHRRERIRIWCNASASHFSRAHPTERFARLLDQTGCDGSAIGLEITETALVADPETASRELDAARELGIAIALDDFGVGHSSLALLRSLPVDTIKIDRTFIRDMVRDPGTEAIVASIVSLSNRLGIDPIAEGVETPRQAQLLTGFGGRHAQGYLWAKAMPLEELSREIDAANEAPTLVGRQQLTASPAVRAQSD